ncbi:hypothetical protein ASE00_08635 [Sphingomonas sp. Root710]|nr:hypothetical protein ASE00_08635 [Sphingomonas sp. Root710]
MIIATVCAALPVLPAVILAFPNEPHIAELAPLIAVLPFLTSALSSVATGVLGERLDRRKLLVPGAAVFAASAVMPIWVESFTLILVSRAVVGLAVGAMMTSAVALTGDYYSGHARQKWLSAQGAAVAVAGMFVSIVSGALGELNWRYAFLPLFVGIPLFLGLITARAPIARSGHVDALTATPSAGAVPRAAWFFIFGLAVAGNALIMPPSFELGALLQEKAVGSSLLTGLALATVSATSALAAFSVARLQRLTPSTKIVLAFGAAGIGTIVIAQASLLTTLFIGAALVGIGQGLLGPTLSIWLLEETPDRMRGRAVGVYTTLTLITFFAAPLIARSAAISLQSSSAAMRSYAALDLIIMLIFAAGRRSAYSRKAP